MEHLFETFFLAFIAVKILKFKYSQFTSPILQKPQFALIYLTQLSIYLFPSLFIFEAILKELFDALVLKLFDVRSYDKSKCFEFYSCYVMHSL